MRIKRFSSEPKLGVLSGRSNGRTFGEFMNTCHTRKPIFLSHYVRPFLLTNSNKLLIKPLRPSYLFFQRRRKELCILVVNTVLASSFVSFQYYHLSRNIRQCYARFCSNDFPESSMPMNTCS